MHIPHPICAEILSCESSLKVAIHLRRLFLLTLPYICTLSCACAFNGERGISHCQATLLAGMSKFNMPDPLLSPNICCRDTAIHTKWSCQLAGSDGFHLMCMATITPFCLPHLLWYNSKERPRRSQSHTPAPQAVTNERKSVPVTSLFHWQTRVVIGAHTGGDMEMASVAPQSHRGVIPLLLSRREGCE